MKTSLRVFLVGLLVTAAGCTWLTVKRFDPSKPDAKGLVYALPKPFLQVTPKPDGTVTVEEVYLPDQDNRFVIDTWSFSSSYTLNVDRDGELLKKVEFAADTTGAATTALDTAATLGTEVLKARNAATEKQQAALEEARKTLAAAELAVEQAAAKLEMFIAADKEAEGILEVRIELQQAIVARDAARTALEALSGRGDGTRTSRFDFPLRAARKELVAAERKVESAVTRGTDMVLGPMAPPDAIRGARQGLKDATDARDQIRRNLDERATRGGGARRNAKDDALGAARAEVDATESALEKTLLSGLDVRLGSNSPGEIEKARGALRGAVAARAAARESLDAAGPDCEPSGEVTFQEIPGPVLYAIDESVDSKGVRTVSLKAVPVRDQVVQAHWETTTLPPPAIVPRFFPRGLIRVKPDEKGSLEMTLTSSENLEGAEIVAPASVPPPGNEIGPKDATIALESATTLKVTITRKLKAGKVYRLVIQYEYIDELERECTDRYPAELTLAAG